MEDNSLLIMNLIIHAGDAKSSAMEAIYAAKKKDFDVANAKIKEANAKINQAHNTQTNLLTEEANGNHTELSLLMIHAQDHLMTALTFLDMAKELIDVYSAMEALKSERGIAND